MRCNVCLAPLTVRGHRTSDTRQALNGKRKVPLYHPCPRLNDRRFHPARVVNEKPHTTAVKRWRKRNPARAKEIWLSWRLRRCYGITLDEYKTMVAEQDGKCAICEEPLDTPSIDHDHKTHKIRGLLCRLCNVAIAHFRDNAKAMLRGASYIANGGFRYAALRERFIPDPEYLAKRNQGGSAGRNRSGRPQRKIRRKDAA